MELQVQKYHSTSIAQLRDGRWVTKHFSTSAEHWTKTQAYSNCMRYPSIFVPLTIFILRKMADAAFEWAGVRGFLHEGRAKYPSSQQVRMDVEESCQHFITFVYRSICIQAYRQRHACPLRILVARYLIRTCRI